MPTKIVITFTLLWVAIAIFMPSTTAKAQSSDCVGVDLVFLVDESNSMKNNDPGDLRVNAVRAAVELLGANVLYDCPDKVHRISVIGFGDENGAETIAFYVRNAEIHPSRDDFQTWEQARDAINNQIPKPTANRGATDYREAFEAAASQLEEWRNSSPDGGPRLRGVAMLTDGGPCVYALGCTVQGNSMNTQGYLNELEDYLDPNGNQFPWHGSNNPDSVLIWLVAFRDTTAGTAYDYLNLDTGYGQMVRGAWDRITSGHGGSVMILRSDGPNDPDVNRDVTSAIADVVDIISGSIFNPIPCPDPFYIDPYLDQINVRIFKIGSNPGVALEDVRVNLRYEGPLAPGSFAGGQGNGDAGSADYYQSDGPNEFYVIGSPSPGKWTLEVINAECRDLDVASRAYDFAGRLLSPASDAVIAQFDEGGFYDPGDPVFFQFELLHDVAGEMRALEPLQQYPISVMVEIERPDGSTQSLTLNQRSDGIWQSQDAIRTPTAGRYYWRIEVKTLNGQQMESVVRFQDTGSFDVKPVDRFHIEIVEPKAQEQQSLNRINGNKIDITPVRVVAKIIDDATGEALTSDQVHAPDADESVLSVVASVNDEKSDPLPMSYDSAAGGWTATLRAGQNGVPLQPGNHTLTVTLNRNAYNRERYRPALQGGDSAAVTTPRNLLLGGAVISPDAQTVVPEFDEGSFYDPAAPVYLTYQLFGWGSSAAPSLGLDKYPLKIEASVDNGTGTPQTFELVPGEGDIWRSAEPIRLPQPGQYTWTLSASVTAPEYKGLIEPIQQTGVFSVSEVGRFHIVVVQPEAGQSYPLNHYADGKQLPEPLPVEVALVDDATGAKLSPQQLTGGEATNILSVTVEMDKQVSEAAPLVFDPKSDGWKAAVPDTLAGMPLTTGEHVARVHFDRTAYDPTHYRLSSSVESQEEVAFRRIRVEPVALITQDLEIVQPAHLGALGCLNSTALPVAVHVFATNPSKQQSPLDPDRITDGKGASLVQARLVDQEGQQQIAAGDISLAETAQGTALLVTFPMTDTPAGNYRVLIQPNRNVLATGYEFYDADEQLESTVNRTYNLLYDPMTCQRAYTGAMVLLAGLAVFMVVNFVRRPVGYLEVVDRGGTPVAERRLGRNLLLLFRPSEVIHLSDPDVAKLVIRKGSSEQADAQNPFGEPEPTSGRSRRAVRAVSVQVYDAEGGRGDDYTLASGNSHPLSGDLDLRYS